MPTSTEEETFTYDPEAAERGWEQTADLRAAVGPSSLPILPLDRVAILGLRVTRELRKSEVRAELDLLHPAHFDPAILDRLEPEAWALWYANDSLFLKETTSSSAKLSAATLQRATEIRSRMMRVAEYMLSTHADAGRIVAEIRSGQGYIDLASDLTRLSRLYADYADILADGGAHYDRDDVDAAKATSAQILLELGENEQEDLKKTKQDVARAFAIFERDYGELRRWSAAIWRDDDFFPSLYSVRSGGRQRRKTSGGEGRDGGGGGPSPDPVEPTEPTEPA